MSTAAADPVGPASPPALRLDSASSVAPDADLLVVESPDAALVQVGVIDGELRVLGVSVAADDLDDVVGPAPVVSPDDLVVTAPPHADPDAEVWPRVSLLGQLLEAVDLPTAATQVVALATSGRGGLVVTMNVDHAVQLDRPGPLRDAYERASLRYADGMPIVWLSHWTRRPLPARVAGSDLVPLVLAAAAEAGLRVHLVGGAPEVAAEAERRIRAAHPALEWTGHVSPPVGFDRDPEVDVAIARSVAAADPHIVLVCLGAPKQEAWVLRHQELLSTSVLLCVGACVDFLAGTKPRAPQWMADAGLEWLFRLSREPRRLWRRYLVDDRRFLRLAAAALLQERRFVPQQR